MARKKSINDIVAQSDRLTAMNRQMGGGRFATIGQAALRAMTQRGLNPFSSNRNVRRGITRMGLNAG
jgi:hypothetical protein